MDAKSCIPTARRELWWLWGLVARLGGKGASVYCISLTVPRGVHVVPSCAARTTVQRRRERLIERAAGLHPADVGFLFTNVSWRRRDNVAGAGRWTGLVEMV